MSDSCSLISSLVALLWLSLCHQLIDIAVDAQSALASFNHVLFYGDGELEVASAIDVFLLVQMNSAAQIIESSYSR